MARDAYNRMNKILDGTPGEFEFMDLPEPTGNIVVQDVFLAPPEKASENIILANISLNFSPGTVTAIVGPSGCGKSSLIRAIVGVWSVFRGAIRYDGKDRKLAPEKLGPFLGYMPQDMELLVTSLKI